MFGLILGTLCLFALIATVRRRNYYRFAHYGCDGPYGHGPYGHRHGFGGFGRGFGRGFARGPHGHARGRRDLLRGLMARLDTTPGQEKAIFSALERARERLSGLGGELGSAGKELAALFGSDVLDGPALDGILSRHRELGDKLSGELRELLSRVHEILDPAQRRTLAELLADGSLFYDLRSRAHHDDY